MPYPVKKIYPQDVIPVEDLLSPNGAAAITLYKGVVVQWDQMLLCDRKIFSIIDDMQWKVRMHLIRVLGVHDQVYFLWKSYMSFIPRSFAENALIEVEVDPGKENEIHGMTRPGKFCYIVVESVVLHTEKKV